MKHTLSWGLATGAALSIFLVILLTTGPGHHDLLYNSDLVLALIAVVLLHRAIRRRGDGSLPYLRALGTGFAVCLIAALCSRIVFFLYLTYVDDSLFAVVAEQWRAHLESQGVAAATVEDRISAMTFSPTKFARGSFLTFLVPSFALTAVASIFTRRRQAPG